MLNYFRPLKFDTYTLSIDNVVCDYYLHPLQRESFLRVLEKLSMEYCCEVTHWDSLRMAPTSCSSRWPCRMAAASGSGSGSTQRKPTMAGFGWSLTLTKLPGMTAFGSSWDV